MARIQTLSCQFPPTVFASGNKMASQQQLPVSGSSHDSNEDSKFFNKGFDAIAQEALSFYHVPGLAIGVIHKGKTYAKVYIHHSPSRPLHALAP
jgi:hypothetical protein